MRAADLFRKYRHSLNPPYNRKDALTILITLLILLVIPLTVFGIKTFRDMRSRAAVTLPAIEITAGARQTFYQNGVPHTDKTGNLLTSYDPLNSFLPIGIYHVSGADYDLDAFTKLKNAGFTFAMVYDNDQWLPSIYVGRAQTADFKIILDMESGWREDWFNTYKNNLYVYGWYLADEPLLNSILNSTNPSQPSQTLADLTKIYDDHKDQTSQVIFATEAPNYTNSTLWPQYIRMGDIGSHDNYLKFRISPLNTFEPLANSMKEQMAALAEAKPSWFVPQDFYSTSPDWTFPSPQENKAQIYTAIVHGATGIFAFSWDSLVTRSVSVIGIRPDVQATYASSDTITATPAQQAEAETLWNSFDAAQGGINFELNQLKPVILSPTAKTSYQVFVDQTPISAAPIRTMLKFYNGNYYLITVNIDKATIKAGFSFPATLSNVTTLYEGGRVPSFSENKLVDDFAPFAVHIYQFQLPSGKTGDLNGDNKVDILDLSVLLSSWGKSGVVADINKDGTVDVYDLSILLSNWGK